jgi:DNA-binding MarR family transcriptional regulator
MSNNSKAKVIEEIGELARLGSLATDLYDEAVCEALGINRTDLRVLDILERSGPLAAGKLAARAGLSPGAMTASIDRLEGAGHARRVRDTSDRRRITVEITPATRTRAQELYGPVNQAYGAVLSGLTLRDLERIREYWQRILDAAETQLARLRAERSTARIS